MLSSAAGILIGLALLTQASDSPSTVEKTIYFRDGTTLRMVLPNVALDLQSRDEDGKISRHDVPLEHVARLQLSQLQQVRTLKRVDRLVLDLAQDSFRIREQAAQELLKLPAAVRSYLDGKMQETTDLEVRVRLRRLLAQLPPQEPGQVKDLADRISLVGSNGITGDLGDWSLRGEYRGIPLELNRQIVEAVEQKPPSLMLQNVPAGIGQVRRLADREQDFPPRTCHRITFDKAPSGEKLEPGMNVSRTFVPVGVALSTSIEGSYVSVNSYDVGGPSRGQSCATHSPLFRGEITIRFCIPGNARIGAGVTRVGFWIAAVRPGGTALEAYDARNRRIGEVKTTEHHRDFLGVHSSVPIAYVKVVPNPEIDADYTIDDLVFDRPTPLLDQGIEQYHTVLLRSGERLHSQDLQIKEERVQLSGLTVGIGELEFSLADAAVVVSPLDRLQPGGLNAVSWSKLADGSIVALQPGERPRLARIADIEIPPEQIAALWGRESNFLELSDAEPPTPSEAVVLTEAGVARLKNWKFGPEWLVGENNVGNFSYRKSPTVWFRAAAPSDDAARLRLANGEEWMLSEEGLFQLVRWTSSGVTIRHGDAEFVIPASDVGSLAFTFGDE